jgi:RNA polymerase sigma-70 factor, ECF subfamily
LTDRPRHDAEDATLVALVARRDLHAFGVLYDRYARDVYALAVHVVPRADAEEIVQDVFVRIWKNAVRFDEARGSFVAWLMTIARNRVLDELRRQGTTRRAFEEIEDVLQHSRDLSIDLEETVWSKDRRQAILEALRELPRDQRRAVVLAYFGGLTRAAIAEELGWPLGTVKKRIQLGLQKLRRALNENLNVEERETDQREVAR